LPAALRAFSIVARTTRERSENVLYRRESSLRIDS
jgi:hypothetical protein